MKSNPDAALECKLIIDYIIAEIRAILRVITSDSLCFYLLTDTLKHAEFLRKELEE